MLATSILLLGLVTAGPADPDDSTTAATAPSPRLWSDVLRVGGVTTAWAALNPSVRSGVLERGSLSHVVANFRSPIRRAIEGAREDQDPFSTNYVAHPLSWALLGLYLRERGYTRGTALLFTQVHSVAWEYVIEGSYQKPSGNDLLANLAGAAVVIYWLRDASDRAAEREKKRLPDRVLALLNPLRPVRGLIRGEGSTTVRLGPVRQGDQTTLGVILSR